MSTNNSTTLTELDKLENYCKEHGYNYSRNSKANDGIFVVDSEGNYLWDAVCHLGSYGYKQGLLEFACPFILESDDCDPIGWLTAEQVLEVAARLETTGSPFAE